MARESTVIIGSGLNPIKKFVPRNAISQERHQRGTSVNILNPEDCSAGMAGAATAVTVGITAVKLPTTPLQYRRAVAVFNNSSETIYIGFDSSVTTTTGWPVPASTSLPMDANAELEIYAIAGTAGLDIRVLELA